LAEFLAGLKGLVLSDELEHEQLGAVRSLLWVFVENLLYELLKLL
jgi:hypothetical protein